MRAPAPPLPDRLTTLSTSCGSAPRWCRTSPPSVRRHQGGPENLSALVRIGRKPSKKCSASKITRRPASSHGRPIRDHPEILVEADAERHLDLRNPRFLPTNVTTLAEGTMMACRPGSFSASVLPARHAEGREFGRPNAEPRQKRRHRSDWRPANRLRRNQCQEIQFTGDGKSCRPD